MELERFKDLEEGSGLLIYEFMNFRIVDGSDFLKDTINILSELEPIDNGYDRYKQESTAAVSV